MTGHAFSPSPGEVKAGKFLGVGKQPVPYTEFQTSQRNKTNKQKQSNKATLARETDLQS